ncbi:MAG: hypothetical protein JWQ48_1127 [Conexibacter sp.]|nr:hypothetical protein [Conexibacter sp.]
MPPSLLLSSTGRDEGAFRPYVRAVRHHPWLVSIIIVLVVGASVAWLSHRQVKYEATAQILVTPITTDSAMSGLPLLTDSIDPTRTLQTAATILNSPRAGVVASGRLGQGAAPLAGVKVNALGDSNIIGVTAQASSANASAAAANAYAAAALSVRSESLRTRVASQLVGLRARRAALGTSDPTTAAALAGDIAQLQSIMNGQDPNFSLLQAAGPGLAIGTKSWVIVALALLGGLVIGIGAALTLEHLDRRLRDEDDLTEAYPLPVLARVPLTKRRNDPLTPPPAIEEAFRTLHVQLEIDDRDHRVVMLTSASVGDGKTTSSIDLAASLVSAGQSVVLLDLDLRKPDVGDRLGVSSDVLGLLRSNMRLSAALVDVPSLPGLRVLSAPPRADISAVLEALTRRLPELLAQARELADFVVIDTAPLGRVSDALRIAAAADDVVLVVRPGSTNRRDLGVTRELLERMGIVPTGMVMIGGSGGSAGYHSYYGPPEREFRGSHVDALDAGARQGELGPRA